MAISQKPIYKVIVTEDIRLSKELLVAAWSEQELYDYIWNLQNDGDERVECDMEDFDEITYRDCWIDGEIIPGQNVGRRGVTPDLDIGGMLPPEEE